ncbi:endonuclease MutS2 [Candidatus Poribacteria bacterium]|nr:endonuclease MutS2 [Candidatus Poribacteria bacterium]
MLDNTIKILEFDKLKEVLKKYAASNLGKLRIETLFPMTDLAEIKHQLKLCSEAKEICLIADGFPLDGLKDIRHLLKKASKIGAILEPEELLDIAGVARAARNVKNAMKKFKEQYPNIQRIVANLPIFSELEAIIEEAISPDAEVLDSASPELRRIRRQIVSTRETIHSKLETTIRSSQTHKFIQESVVTLRNDRYVIPVKEDFKDALPGIIQGQSASGATVFVEPAGIVEYNNNLHRLASEELQEILRILRVLTDDVRSFLPELEIALDILSEIDFLSVKAKFSIEFRCIEPLLNDRGYTKLIRARHPLLELSLREPLRLMIVDCRLSIEKTPNHQSSIINHQSNRPEKVIPTDIYIGDAFTTLVITGPNTGGKTVALKTVGLLTLMAQSGLHIPAMDGSEIAVFGQIFSDIGDEQSIEQNLSTFSSHITKIVDIINQVDANSLVLLDEIGAGTDPTEGAALGMAIIDYLHSTGARTIITTHHGILKAHAHSQPGMENASMEFDWRSLQPTYRLQIGVPGSSNAIKISEHLGMPEHIREAARNYLGTEQVAIEELIASMEKERRKLEYELKLAQDKKLSADKIQQTYDKLLQQLEAEQTQLRENAEREASEIVNNARKLIENTVAQIRREQASKESIRAAHTVVDKLREDFKTSKKQSSKVIQPPLRTFQIGDKVRVKSLDRFGEIVQLPDVQDMLQVQVGNMNITVPIVDVQKATPTYNKPKLSPSVLELQYQKRGVISKTLSLRGDTVEEALDKLDKYLDDALLAGLEEVIILHGKGTGALKNAVIEFLKDYPHVVNFRPGRYNEGEYGVTVVTLKG